MVPKKGLLTALSWNLPLFLVKPDLHNGLGVACRNASGLFSAL